MHVRAEAGVKRVRELHDRVVADVVVEHAVRRERRRVPFGVAGVERPVVLRVELLDFDQVVRGQLAAALLRGEPRAAAEERDAHERPHFSRHGSPFAPGEGRQPSHCRAGVKTERMNERPCDERQGTREESGAQPARTSRPAGSEALSVIEGPALCPLAHQG